MAGDTTGWYRDVRIMVLKRGENSEHHGSIGSLTFRFLVGG